MESSRKIERQHPCMPTNQEATENPESVYSNHALILGRVPLGSTGDALNILSLNTLEATSFSGFNHQPMLNDEKSNGEGKIARYKRMMTTVLKAVNLNDVDVIFLQETDPDLAAVCLTVPDLNNVRSVKKLDANWSFIRLPKSNELPMLVAFRNDRYKRLIEKPDNSMVDRETKLMSFSLRKFTTGQIIDLHNIWGAFNPDEHDRQESEYRALLNASEQDRIAVLFGDTNSRIAPTDDTPRNITTGIFPTSFNSKFNLDKDHQLSDFPDGGFHRQADGSIEQIRIEILNHNGFPFYDNREKTEISPHPRQVRILTLDKKYDAERQYLSELLGENIPFHYAVTSNSYNEKKIELTYNLSNQNIILEKLRTFMPREPIVINEKYKGLYPDRDYIVLENELSKLVMNKTSFRIQDQLDKLCSENQDLNNLLKIPCEIYRLRNIFSLFSETTSLYQYLIQLDQLGDSAGIQKAHTILEHIRNQDWASLEQTLAVTRNWFDPLTTTTGSKIFNALREEGQLAVKNNININTI